MKSLGFYDLNISLNQLGENSLDNVSISKICERLFEYGYRTVAFNQSVVLSSDMFRKSKKKRKMMDPDENLEIQKEVDPVPAPEKINLPENLQGKLHVYNRLTVHIKEISVLEKLNKNGNLKLYHILAICPQTIDCIAAIGSLPLDMDILEIDVANPDLPKFFSKKIINNIVDKNLFVEVKYSPVVSDSTNLKNTLQFSHLINRYQFSKNIIFSSGATSMSNIRGPYDVINLGVLFGFHEGQAKAAISSFCRSLFLRAEERWLGKVPVLLKAVSPKKGKNKSDNQSESKRKRSEDEPMEYE